MKTMKTEQNSNFKKEFPELEKLVFPIEDALLDKQTWLVHVDDVQRFCLSRQRVKEAIERLSKEMSEASHELDRLLKEFAKQQEGKP